MKAAEHRWRVLVLAACVAAAGTAFVPLFSDRRLYGVVFGAAAAAAAVELAFLQTRWPGAFRPAVHLVAAFVVGQAVLFFGASTFGLPGPASTKAMLVASHEGWVDLLTTPLPAPTTGLFLVVPFLVTWCGVVVSAAMVTRFPTWTHLLGMTSVLIVALAVGPSESPLFVPAAVGAAVLTLGYLTWASSLAKRATGEHVTEAHRRHLHPAAVPLVALAAAMVAGSPAALGDAGSGRSTLRSLFTPQFDASVLPSPLSEFKAHRASAVADRVVFEVSVAGPARPPARLRIAALDRYDGRIWSAGGAGSRLGGTFEDLRSVTPERVDRTAGATIRIRDLQGAWLPTLGSTGAITASGSLLARAKINPSVGTLVVPGGVRAGDTYRVQSSGASPSPAALRSAPLDTSDGVGDAIQLPASMATLTQSLAPTATDPYDRARAITEFFRTKGFVDPDAVPGHSLGRLAAFANSTTPPVGSGEQFAAAAAAMLRSVGFPVRVAVGFQTAGTGRALSFRNRDVAAWVEVRFQGFGWVPLDVTPPASRRPSQRTVERLDLPSSSASGSTDGGRLGDSANRVAPKTKNAPVASPHRPFWNAFTITGAVVLGLLMVIGSYLALVAFVKRRRRNARRGHSDPYQRVMGAFDEVLDRHSELGWRVTGAASLRQIGREFGPEPGAVAMRRLVSVTELATFHAGLPTDDMVRESWEAAESVLQGLTNDATLTQRIRALADPRPLLESMRHG